MSPARLPALLLAAHLAACAATEAVDTPLHDAVARDRYGAALSLLDEGAKVDARGAFGRTPLFAAMSSHHPRLIGLLVDRGADLEATDTLGMTPVLFAAKRGWLWSIPLLVVHGADAAKVEPDKQRGVLHLAALTNTKELEYIEGLLGLGLDVDARDGLTLTPLHLAASNGRAVAVRALVDFGADPSLRNKFGNQPLHLAARDEHAEVVQILLERGADPNARDGDGELPLHRATRAKNVEIVKALVAAGADTAAVDAEGRSPLDLLTLGADPALEVTLGGTGESHSPLLLMIQRGTLYDPEVTQRPEKVTQQKDWRFAINRRDELGLCPMAFAAARGDVRSVQVLVAAGARLEVSHSTPRGEEPVEWSGWKPLHFAAAHAASMDAAAVIPVLVEAGADVDSRDWRGRTPLFLAAEYGSAEAAAALVEAGADLKRYAKSGPYEGLFALQVAARANLRDVVAVLAAAENSVDWHDEQGRTALHVAVTAGAYEAAEALLSAGANPNKRDFSGVSPRELAAGGNCAPKLRALLAAD